MPKPTQPITSNIDVVKENRIWREAVHREHKYNKVSVNFGMNVMRCKPPPAQIKFSHDPIGLVASKITSSETDNFGSDWEKSFEAGNIKHKEMTPQTRWDLPQTTSMDVGWLLGRPALADELIENRFTISSSTVSPPRLLKGKWEPTAAVNTRSIPRSKSHDILDPLLKALCPKENAAPFHNSCGCDVTKFADVYVKDKHCSPFSKHK